MSMDDYPRVFYEEYESNESSAKQVEQILKEADDFLIGESLTESRIILWERYLISLLDHVTLITYTFISNYYSIKKYEKKKLLVYFYNEDAARLLRYWQLLCNDFNGMYEDINYRYEEYRMNCIKNNRCLVYDVDDTYGERVFNLNYDLSDMEHVIPVSLKKN